MDYIGLASIAQETSKDPVLKKLGDIIRKGKTWIPKLGPEKLKMFQKILPEITLTGNGILLKEQRIILPESLQTTAIQLAQR